MIPLICLSVAHWAILLRGMFVINAVWSPAAKTCVVVKLDSKFLQATFFCSQYFQSGSRTSGPDELFIVAMAVDFTILVLTSIALYQFPHSGVRSDLWNLLFRDGLVYFLVTFSFNAVPAILNVLQLNNVMNV